MSSVSKGMPEVWKVGTEKKGVETVMTELDQLKEFVICSIDELRDEGFVYCTITKEQLLPMMNVFSQYIAAICDFLSHMLNVLYDVI